jgi:3-oxoacyl-[acyl-carrier-protein] synthase II
MSFDLSALKQLDDHQRVVVTGLGAITPIGHSVPEFWESALAGRSGVKVITEFDTSAYPTKIAALIRGFDPSDYMDRKQARRMSRFSQLAVAAAREAIQDACLDLEKEDRERCGVLLGCAIGGLDDTEATVKKMLTKGGMRVSPFFIVMMPPNLAAFQVAYTYGFLGYNNTVATACAAGTQAIGEAAEVIRRGDADVMITGGTEAGMCELGLAVFCVGRAYSTRNDEPEKASRPFDRDRDGFVGGEGCGIIVLESLAHAKRRGARIYCEVLGYGASNDAYHLIAPDPTGSGAARAMRAALRRAGIPPEAVDYVNAHGTGTPLGDPAETNAMKQVFGEHAYKLAISSTKSMIGHLWGAAGAVEGIATIKAIETGWVHPTINLDNPDPECDLDYVPNVARQMQVDIAMSNNFGLGGQNASIIFARYEE